MKKPNLILLLIFAAIVMVAFLASCEKPKNFECSQTITMQKKGSTCGPSELVVSGAMNLTWDEKWDLEHTVKEGWSVINKDSVWTTSKYHCIPAYCPEY